MMCACVCVSLRGAGAAVVQELATSSSVEALLNDTKWTPATARRRHRVREEAALVVSVQPC